MPDPTMSASNADINATSPNAVLLQNLALRYAAGELMCEDCAVFEARLATDQDARDALSEAVRLSAAALGQSPPVPHRSFRLVIQERLCGWRPSWLARRAYRGHPLIWSGLGAAAVAVCTVFALSNDDRDAEVEKPATASTLTTVPAEPAEAGAKPTAPAPRTAAVETTPLAHVSGEHAATTGATPGSVGVSASPSVAEIWANLSTPDHIEKAHEEELRWRKKLQEMGPIHPMKPQAQSSIKE